MTGCITCLNDSSINPLYRTSSSIEGFLFNMMADLFIFSAVFLLFLFIRRTRLMHPLPFDPEGKNGFVDWVIPLLRRSEDQVLRAAGLDGYMILCLAKLGMATFALGSLLGLGILLPLDYDAGNNMTGMDQLSFTNVPADSPRLWCHFMMNYIFSLGAFYLLDRYYGKFVLLRRKYLAEHRGIHHYSIFIQRLPKDLRNDHELKSFLEDIYGPVVENVHVAFYDRRLTRLVELREESFRKLERAIWNAEHSKKEVTHRTGFLGLWGPVVNSRAYYTEKVLHLNNQIIAEQKRERKRSSAAFVTFKTLTAQALATQAFHSSNLLRFQVQFAPEPHDVIWRNIGVPTFTKVVGRLAVAGVLALIMIFWSVPVIFISSLTTLQNLISLFPFLEFVNDHPALTGFLEGFLPTLSLSVFITLLPYFLRLLVIFEFLPTRSASERSVLSKFFLFLFVNVFLIVSVSGTVFTALEEIVYHPTVVVESLAHSLPQVSIFFTNYVYFWAAVGIPLEFLRWGFPIIQWVMLAFLARTEREKRRIYDMDFMIYDFYCAIMLLIFVIALNYSTIAPIIMPVATIFFAMCYFVFSYQISHVYPRRYESEGKWWPYVHTRILSGIVVFQLTMMGIFGLKGNVAASTLSAPLPFLTFAFAWYSHRKFHQSTTSMPLDLAMQLDEAERDLQTMIIRDHTYFYNPALRAEPLDIPLSGGGSAIELGVIRKGSLGGSGGAGVNGGGRHHDGGGGDGDDDDELVLEMEGQAADEDGDEEILLPNRKSRAQDFDFGAVASPSEIFEEIMGRFSGDDEDRDDDIDDFDRRGKAKEKEKEKERRAAKRMGSKVSIALPSSPLSLTAPFSPTSPTSPRSRPALVAHRAGGDGEDGDGGSGGGGGSYEQRHRYDDTYDDNDADDRTGMGDYASETERIF